MAPWRSGCAESLSSNPDQTWLVVSDTADEVASWLTVAATGAAETAATHTLVKVSRATTIVPASRVFRTSEPPSRPKQLWPGLYLLL